MSKRPTTFINSLKVGEMYTAIKNHDLGHVKRLVDTTDLLAHNGSLLRWAVSKGTPEIVDVLLHHAQWNPDGELLILAAALADQNLYNILHPYADFNHTLNLLDSPPFGSEWKNHATDLKNTVQEMENQFQHTLLSTTVEQKCETSRQRKSKM